ncbi:MAG TPA: Ig-like domain-containing protein [Myxococcales bacterium]|nr:Ig-like domain-containing protein [Myxococcales bacterium]
MTSFRSRALATAAIAAALMGHGCSCQSPAASFAFTVQPAGGVAGGAISPAVVVTALDKDGNQATTFTGDVTVSVSSGPAGASLTGPTRVGAKSGVATFDGLVLDKAGVYTLGASSDGVPAASSAAFTIAPGPDESLAFVVEPQDTSINRAFTPAVQVGIKDRFGNITHSIATVQIQLAENPGNGTLRGTASVAALDGIATFSDLSLDQFGAGYKLSASSGSLAQAVSQEFAITRPRLAYSAPTAPGAKVRLVRDDANSTDTSILLVLQASASFSGYSIGMDLPLDVAKIVPGTTVFTPGTVFPPGQPPSVQAYGGRIPASGPLAGVLVTGQSQRPTGAGAVTGDTAVTAGAIFYTFRLNMPAIPNFGVVFDGANLGPRFRAAVRDRQGTEVVAASEFGIGKLEVR